MTDLRFIFNKTNYQNILYLHKYFVLIKMLQNTLYTQNISFNSKNRLDFRDNIEATTTPLTNSQTAVISSAPILSQVLLIYILLLLLVYLIVSIEFIRLRFVSVISYINSLCKQNLLSSYEVLSVTTIFSSLGILSMTSSFSFDDLLDFQVVAIFILVSLSITLSLFFLNIFLLYSISSNSNGESLKKIILSDLLNIILCFIRILLC